MSHKLKKIFAVAALAASAWFAPGAQAADPIKIGVGMSITGPLASNGKAALLAMQLWTEDVNSKGGLLGRQVQIVSYDDQSNPANVPALYSKLLDLDKVDLVVSGYGTAIAAAAMPTVMQRGMVFMNLVGLGVNEKFNYDRYFGITPLGPTPKAAFSQGFFETVKSLKPMPKKVAIIGVDNEFGNLATEGARANAKAAGLEIVYDRPYPPTTMDMAPVIRAVQAKNPDVLFIASYPTDSVAIVRALSETNFKAQLLGGGMIGLQYASFKTQLGPQLNNLLYYDLYVPEPTLKFQGIEDFLKRYQAKATGEGVDALGYYVPPVVYSAMQMLGQAVTKAGSMDQKKMADVLHKEKFSTVIGDVKFAPNGEWDKARLLWVQYQNVAGNDLAQFRKPGTHVIIYPQQYASGKLATPFPAAKR